MRLFLAILIAALPAEGFARSFARVRSVRGAPVALMGGFSGPRALLQAPTLDLGNAADFEQTFTKAVEWVESVESVEFIASSKRTFSALRSPVATVEEKRAAVAETIALLEDACAGSCKSAYEVLAGIGTQIVDLYEAEALAGLKESVGVPVAELRKAIKKFSDALYRSDPAILQYRLGALLDLIKYLLETQETAFFALFQPGGGPKAALGHGARNGIEFFKQATTLAQLAFRLQQSKKRNAISPDEMKKIIGNIQELGFFYVKLAQSLSNSAIAFEPEAVEELKFLQDRLPPMEANVVLQVVREDFGREAGEIFVDFDASKPIATGTIAQTYRAKLRTRWGGLRPVVIKVQRPGLLKRLDNNRTLNGVMLRAARVFSEPAYEPVFEFGRDQVRGLEDAFEGELDFVAEGGRTARFRSKSLLGWGLAAAPKVYHDRTTRRVLTMSDLPGDNVDRMIERLRRLRKNPEAEAHRLKVVRRIFSKILRTVLDQAFVQREMHADLHPGNVLATRRGRLGFVDWSQTFSTRGLLFRPLRLVWHGAQGNADKFARVLSKMGVGEFSDTERLTEISRASFAGHPGGWAWDWSDEELGQAISSAVTIVRRARGELGHRLSPGYLQLFRTLVPVFGTLYSLGKMLPRETIVRELVWRGLFLFPVGLVRRALNAIVAGPLRRYEIWTDAPLKTAR